VIFQKLPQAGRLGVLFERFVFRALLLAYGVFFALGIVLWLGFEYGFTRGRKILGFFMFCFGVIEIAIHAISDDAQAVFISAIPTFEAAIIPITVWAAGISVL